MDFLNRVLRGASGTGEGLRPLVRSSELVNAQPPAAPPRTEGQVMEQPLAEGWAPAPPPRPPRSLVVEPPSPLSFTSGDALGPPVDLPRRASSRMQASPSATTSEPEGDRSPAHDLRSVAEPRLEPLQPSIRLGPPAEHNPREALRSPLAPSAPDPFAARGEAPRPTEPRHEHVDPLRPHMRAQDHVERNEPLAPDPLRARPPHRASDSAHSHAAAPAPAPSPKAVRPHPSVAPGPLLASSVQPETRVDGLRLGLEGFARRSTPEREPTTIEITIGRVEIRAERPRAPAPRRSTTPSPPLTLREYLDRKSERRR